MSIFKHVRQGHEVNFQDDNMWPPFQLLLGGLKCDLFDYQTCTMFAILINKYLIDF